MSHAITLQEYLIHKDIKIDFICSYLKWFKYRWYNSESENNNHHVISPTCTPAKEVTPMYKKTPYSTDIGTCFNTGVKNTELPIKMWIITPVTLCSLRYEGIRVKVRCEYWCKSYVMVLVLSNTEGVEREYSLQESFSRLLEKYKKI